MLVMLTCLQQKGATMASRNEVIQFIQSNYPVELVFGGQMMKLTKMWNDGRSQLLFATVDDEKIEVRSPFARTDQISAEKALELNPTVFGVARMGEWYCLAHVVPVENVDASEIQLAFDGLAELADEFERQLGLGDDL